MFTLGRKVDINYSTNRITVILSLLTAAIGWIITGKFLSGVYIGAGIFSTWALAREVDPKAEYEAFICVFISLLNLFYYENIQLLEIFWILLTMRLVSGITGKKLTFLDMFSVLGMAIYLSINNQNSIYLIPFILAIVFLIAFKEKIGLSLIAGGTALLTFIVESFSMNYLSLKSMANLETLNIIVIAMIFLFFIFWNSLSKDEIKDDLGNIANRDKILSSQIIYSLAVVLICFFGDVSINNLIIYLSVTLGIIIYRIGYKLINDIFKRQ